MAISAEWILNRARQKIYAISHAKAVVRNNKTVDDDLTELEKAVSQLQTEVDGMDLEAVNAHIAEKISTAEGSHGLRYYNDELQYFNGTAWITIETGSGGLPPSDMKAVEVTLGDDGTKLTIKGTDPDDLTADGGKVLVKWQGTKVVRKVGSYPTKVSDGTLVVDYQVRNQYQNNGFTDTGLIKGVTYYYRWFPYSDQGAYNVSENPNVNRANKAPDDYQVIGCIADWANNSYTRTDRAVGQSAGTFFDRFKCFGGRKRCIVADDRTVLAFRGQAGYTETGKLTQAITKYGRTYAVGTSVQVMVYQPKFYYKVTPMTKVANPYGTGYMIRKAQYQVSDVKYSGFKVHPQFVRNGKEIPYILLSAFEAGTQNSSNGYITDGASIGNRLSSIAGSKPVTGNAGTFTRAVARNLAKARGTGWQIGDVLTASASQMLATIEYNGMNLQTLLGRGVVDLSSSYANVVASGETSSLGDKSGRNTAKSDGAGSVSYRGEENLYGNVWTWQDGGNCINGGQGIMYIADNGFADDTTAAPYKSTGFNFARGNGYVSAFGYSDTCDFLFIPCEVSGDSANPVGDYFYQNVSGSAMTVACLGSNCADGSNAGLFYWYVHTASSYSYWDVGSRLVCVPAEDAPDELVGWAA